MESFGAISDLFANRDPLVTVAIIGAAVYFGWPYVSTFVAKQVAAFLDLVDSHRAK